MSVQRGINSRTLRNYFPVKKCTNPHGTKGSGDLLANSAFCKQSTIQSTTVSNGETSTKDASSVNVTNRNCCELHLYKKTHDDCKQSTKLFTAINKDQLSSVSTGNDRTGSIEKDILSSPRKRKACSQNEEVNDVNPLKMAKLNSMSSNVTQIGKQSNTVDTNLNNASYIKITNTKTIAVNEMKAKLLKPENAKVLKQMIESKKKIEQAKEELKNHKQVVEKHSTVKEPTDSLTECEPKKEVADRKVPAYERFHSLASTDATTTLILPLKYRVLSEMFRCLDMAVGIISNRKEVITFKKIKVAVQEMLRRAFELRHLGQIKTVFPTAFHFQQDKLPSRGIYSSATEYHLTIIQNLQCFAKDVHCNYNKYESTAQSMTPSFLVERRKFFHTQLLELVKKYHDEFLAAQVPPIKVDSNKLIRWHPQFRLDDVPDIVPSELPLPEEIQAVTTAKEVLAKVKGLYSTKIDCALENIISNSTTVPSGAESEMKTKNNAALKGIPLTLLEKIRAKEAAKLKEEMTRSPVTDARLKMISRLPEISRILRNLFISEKKAALLTSYAVDKLMESYNGSLNEGEMEDHLNLLTELVPIWASMIQLKKGSFFKLNKNVNFNDVITKLETALQNSKCES